MSNVVERRIEVPFDAVVGTTTIRCGAQLENLGTQSSSGTMTDFRFFVHDLYVVLDDGKKILVELDETSMQTDNIAMIDLRDKLDACEGAANPDYNDKLVGSFYINSVDVDRIVSIRFGLGVPHSHNHLDQSIAAGPLRNPGLASGMAWNWNNGYKFTGLDIQLDTPLTTYNPDGTVKGTASKWMFHIGSIACTGAANLGETVVCTYPNRRDISLTAYTLNQKKVRLDYAELMRDSDLTQDHSSAVGCMSNAGDKECAKPYTRIGLVHPLSGGDPAHLPEQTVFSLVAR